jgi:hypothetical protein
MSEPEIYPGCPTGEITGTDYKSDGDFPTRLIYKPCSRVGVNVNPERLEYCKRTFVGGGN